ncbi:hypothetical protein NDU88_009140, partial [Pleurodeles waltl]
MTQKSNGRNPLIVVTELHSNPSFFALIHLPSVLVQQGHLLVTSERVTIHLRVVMVFTDQCNGVRAAEEHGGSAQSSWSCVQLSRVLAPFSTQDVPSNDNLVAERVTKAVMYQWSVVRCTLAVTVSRDWSE